MQAKQLASIDEHIQGKQSIDELIKQNQGVTSMIVGDEGLRTFERIAKKYGVDFAVMKDTSEKPPVFTAFFKARDTDAMEAVVNEYSKKMVKKLVATIRSREISAWLFLQVKSQLKVIYKDNTDTIIGNMDFQLFLGGTEPTTLKDLSLFLGKVTIDMYNTGESRGNNPSYSMNYQKSGKDLMTMDEIAVMDGDKCILQLRGVRPFLSDKYDITQHPLYKETGEYDERNKLAIQRFLHQGIKAKSGEMFDVVRI